MPAATMSKKTLVPNHDHMKPATAARAPKKTAEPSKSGREDGVNAVGTGSAIGLS